MPLAVLIVYLYGMFTIKPVGVVDSYAMSVVAGFFAMVWLGMTYNTLEDMVSEQILILRIKSDTKYYISDVIFLTVISLIISALLAVFPVYQDLVNGRDLFLRPLEAMDVISGFVLIFASSFAGGAAGSLMHQRIVKNRRIAVVATALIALIAVTKGAIGEEFALFSIVAWLFPPIYDVVKIFTKEEFFEVFKVLRAALMLLVYGGCVYTLKVWLLKKKRF